MGINCLWPFLKNFKRKVHFREFSSQTAAVDASCWLHKALYVSISKWKLRRCGSIFQGYVRAVKEAGITPFVVFDGFRLPAKANEDDRRRRDREKLLTRADERNLSLEENNRLLGQAVSITFDDITTCINVCLSENVNYIVSPYESDAQIAFLLANGYADFAITEDSDLLAYGCKKVMVKASMSGDGEFFILTEVLEGLKLSMNRFQQMCIVAGCDYLRNVKGIGIQRAFQMVASGGDLVELLTTKGASEEYKKCFDKVKGSVATSNSI